MKKKGWMLFGLVAAVLLAGCKKEPQVPVDAILDAIEKAKEESTLSEAPEATMPVEITATPAPTATPTPEQRVLGEHIRDHHGDEISARLVERGYCYEVNESCEDSGFRFEFKAVTGDTETPVLLFEFYVEEEELTNSFNELELSVYLLGEEMFDTNPELYWTCEGYGRQDETDKSLYHVTLPGTPYGITNGGPMVVDILRVTFGKNTSEPKEYHIETPEYRLTIPQQKFCPIEKREYTGVTFSSGGNEYTLTRTLYGQYEAEFYFEGDIPSGNVVVEAGREGQRDNDFQPQWSEFVSELTLEVDGTEYRITDENYMVLEEAGNTYTGFANPAFPAVDFTHAEQVFLWMDTEGYDLKKADGKLLTRERPVKAPDVAFNEPFQISAGETLVVGRSGIELTMKKIFYDEAEKETYFVYQMEIDGKQLEGEGWSNERGNHILQREFTEHVVKLVECGEDEVTLLLTEDYEVQKPLVLSGNAEDTYLTERIEYVESEHIVLFVDQGVTLQGNVMELLESLYGQMEDETGWKFLNDTKYSKQTGDLRFFLWGSEAFLGVDMNQEKFHIFVVPQEEFWPSSAGFAIVIDPSDLDIEGGHGDVVIHEMAHAIQERNGAMMDGILDEGFASYMQGKVSEEDKLFTFHYNGDENYGYKWLDIRPENAQEMFVREWPTTEPHYYYGYWFVTYLFETYGDDIYRKIHTEATSRLNGMSSLSKEEMIPVLKEVVSETVFEDFGAWFEEKAKAWDESRNVDIQ